MGLLQEIATSLSGDNLKRLSAGQANFADPNSPDQQRLQEMIKNIDPNQLQQIFVKSLRMSRKPFTIASSLRVPFSVGFLRKAVLFVAGLVPFLAPSVARADLYVVDGDLVARFDSSTGAIVQTNGQNTFTSLVSSTGITAGPDGLIYVATTDPSSNPGSPVVNRYNATTGAQVGGAFVPFVNGAAQLSNAQGLAFGPDGHFYVADLGDNGAVKSFSAGGGYLDTYATQGGNAESVAFNPATPGNVYVATGSTIEQINLTTHANTIIVQGTSNPLTFNNGSDLTFGPDGKLYVLDTSSSDPRIVRYNTDGTGQSVFADFNSAEFSSEVFQPTNFAFGPDGALYVSGLNQESGSSQQGEILRISSNGDSFSDFVTNLNSPGFLAFTAVPEPTTFALAGLGLVGLSVVARRKKNSRA
jgi:glucose/arabinose dehydrogenase